MNDARIALGRYGEEVAARRLAEAGLTVLDRNWRCQDGELDIVALEGDTLAVCEVKTRSERGFQQPAEAIDTTRANRLRRLAERWLAERWPIYFVRLAAAAAESARLGSPVPMLDEIIDGVPGGPPDQPSGPVPPPPGGVRIDLVAVVNRLKGAASVEHLRGAI